jgi:hypothetical protein
LKRLFLLAALVVAPIGLLSLGGTAAASSSSVVYNNIPSPQPGNVASEAFEAQSGSEFGGQIQLAGTTRTNPTVTVLMSSWGCQSGHWYSGDCSTTSGATFSEPITLTVYNVGANGAVGTPIASANQTFNVPYRPSADNSNCTGSDAGKWYSASDNTCYNGFATPISFSLTGVTLPDKVIVSVAFNTTHYGYQPYGESTTCFTSSGGCGYDSLNVGVDNAVTVGSDPQPNDAYLNSSSDGAYCDGGTGGTGLFRLDSGCWTGYQPAIEVTASAACTPTGLMRDGLNLTAAEINPAVTVSGTVDASGCNIGVYYSPGHTGTVSGADISGANYYGVVANAANVNIANSQIHDIGETPFNGSQHGVDVLYTTINQDGTSTGSAASGTLSGSTITRYQKNGVVVSGSHVSVTVKNNTVTGAGPVNYIAQNGIEIASGASASVTGNTVSGNWYTGPTYTACGLLFYQAGGVKQSANTLFANQTNLCNAGRGGGNFKP